MPEFPDTKPLLSNLNVTSTSVPKIFGVQRKTRLKGERSTYDTLQVKFFQKSP